MLNNELHLDYAAFPVKLDEKRGDGVGSGSFSIEPEGARTRFGGNLTPDPQVRVRIAPSATGNGERRRRPLSFLRAAVLICIGLFLGWKVLTHSFAAYLAEVAPQAALKLNSQQPVALVNLAEQALKASEGLDQEGGGPSPAASAALVQDEGRGPGDTADTQFDLDRAFAAFSARPDSASATDRRTVSSGPPVPNSEDRLVLPVELARRVRVWAEAALRADPLNARALRILGQLAASAQDDAKATDFMEAAARLSLHESVALDWLVRRSLDQRDYERAAFYADALLRTRPELAASVVPELAEMAEDKEALPVMEQALATNPPWREQFFALLPGGVADARTPFTLLESLKTSSAPPTAAEVGRYLDFLIGAKAYDLAHYTWLEFLEPEQLGDAGFLFDGSFERPTSKGPFDWRISQGAGVTIDVAPRPDKAGEHALLVEFQYGRVDFQSVTQLVVLAPGSYRFRGKYKGELVGSRGLKWRLACVDGGRTIAESPSISGVAKTWKDVEFSWTVLAGDCPAQVVRLDLDARMASERFISGSAWFDELEISRVDDVQRNVLLRNDKTQQE